MSNPGLIEKMKATDNKAEKCLLMLSARGVELTSDERAAFFRCFGVRGKYKGYLKRSAPSSTRDPLANVIYNAIQPNGFKVQVFNLMMMPDNCRETYNKLASYKFPDWIDLDKETLQKWGAW